MAKQIISKKSTPDASIVEAFERVFLKSPSPSDIESAKAFIGGTETANATGWEKLFVDYCHVLINSNSFLHME